MKRSDYEKLAEKVVDSLGDGHTLEDGVVEMAKSKSLNPEQIRRLVEMVNTAAFLKMFGDTSGDDRMVDFDVADPRAIIKRFFSEMPSAGKKSVTITVSGSPDEEFFSDIADELRGTKRIPEEMPEEESEGAMKAAHVVEAKMGKFKKLRIREVLLDKVASANYAAEDLARDIASGFRGIYGKDKLAAFEADAFALYKSSAAAPLKAVREVLGIKESSFEDARKSSTNRLVTSDKTLAKVAEFIEVVGTYTSAKKALTHLERL